jgi:hypothetical protein
MRLNAVWKSLFRAGTSFWPAAKWEHTKQRLVELTVRRTAMDPLLPVAPPIPVFTSPMAKSRTEASREARQKRMRQTPTWEWKKFCLRRKEEMFGSYQLLAAKNNKVLGIWSKFSLLELIHRSLKPITPKSLIGGAGFDQIAGIQVHNFLKSHGYQIIV